MNVSFLVGSRAFFEGIKGFVPHDTDKLEFIDNPTDFKIHRQITLFNSRCYFQWKNMSKDELIEYHLTQDCGMLIGKFLVPQVANYLGLTIKDLIKLKPLIDKLDDKHKYEEIIYNAYIENNSFELTYEQRISAYNEYIKQRN